MQTLTSKILADFETPLSNNKVLMLNGYSAIQSCIYNEYKEGTLFLKENMLLFIIEGTLNICYGKEKYSVCKNQMAYLKKDILFEYQTGIESGDNGKVEYILVSLKYELVKEFTKIAELSFAVTEVSSPVTINMIDDRLLNYINSLEPYFMEPKKVEASLIKIKLLELLFYLSGNNNKILEQVLDLREHFRNNITTTVEDNIMNSLSLNELAVLSGRSLSSFRRDFLSIYNMPPSQWIREKRLKKAQEYLQSTTMTVTDICYTLGFESIAHFSRIFKSRFGYPPSGFRHNILVA